MSKSHEEELVRLYEALARDALCSFPQLEAEFQRDLVRLKRVLQVRGVEVFTVDLPAFGKHFDRCLAGGQWTASDLPLTGRVASGPNFPRFLRGLFKLVFEESGLLKMDDLDVEAVLFIRQFLYCAKKTELPCPKAAELREIEEFVAVDEALPIPEKVWEMTSVTADLMLATYQGFRSEDSGWRERFTAEGIPISKARLLCENLDLVSGLVASTLGHYAWEEWSFRHGSGAIAEKTGLVNKYHWDNWSDRLEGRFPIADCGFHNWGAWADSDFRYDVSSHEPMSRLIAVPKTSLKPRLIAAEPSEHMWCQQNLLDYFDERCKTTWIGQFVDYHDQTRNQELCRVGSRDGSLLTCDLSSASDRVSCAVVGQVFRSNPELLCALQAVRTRFVWQGIHPDMPNEIELRKFSTMGSACTFPVESLVFLTVVLSVVVTNDGRRATPRDIKSLVGRVAVYGDDIIAPCDCWELLQKALSALHFKVNTSKSYATGRFRESCGVDAFRGVDVTPTYWKGICNNNPESILSALEVRNNLHKRFFMSAARQVESTIPCAFVTVAMDSGVVGKKSFVRPDLSGFTLRWNRDLQRIEAMSSVLSSRSEKLEPYDDSGVLQYFTEQPAPETFWQAGIALRPRLQIRRAWIPIELTGYVARKL